MRQFGTFLKRDDVVGAGIGMSLKLDNFTRWNIARPTIVFEGKASYTVAGGFIFRIKKIFYFKYLK